MLKTKTFEEIKVDINHRRDIPCSWIGRINKVKILVFPKFLYKMLTIPLRISENFWRQDQ